MKNVMEYARRHQLTLVIAAGLLGYAVGIVARPNASIATVAWIQATFGLHPYAVALLFVLAALGMASARHELRFLALVPLVAYSAASSIFILGNPTFTLVAAFQHITLSVLAYAVVRHQFKHGANNGHIN